MCARHGAWRVENKGEKGTDLFNLYSMDINAVMGRNFLLGSLVSLI